jgi:cytochrome c oxidase cbb3-type subunit 1
VYSYRLSIVHFWALITLYIWAGPHHLHYTALPDWAQSLGMAMSLILLAPSWGGMINGMMTLSGAWHKLRTDPILRFLVLSLAFYGMSTFEGPMMAIKTVNALSHYTDWTIGHVHAGALGWVAMITFGATVPHGAEGLRPRADAQHAADQPALLAGDHRHGAVHRLNVGQRHHPGPDVAGDQRRRHPHLLLCRGAAGQSSGFVVRFAGGVFFLSGMLLMAYNVWRTVRVADVAWRAVRRRSPDEAEDGYFLECAGRGVSVAGGGVLPAPVRRQSLDDASLMPFADDPEVARRVELARKTVKAVAEQAKPGWINLDM